METYTRIRAKRLRLSSRFHEAKFIDERVGEHHCKAAVHACSTVDTVSNHTIAGYSEGTIPTLPSH